MLEADEEQGFKKNIFKTCITTMTTHDQSSATPGVGVNPGS